MSLSQKFFLALTVYVALGLLAWQTLTEDKLRYATWVILAFFAFRSYMLWRQHKARQE